MLSVAAFDVDDPEVGVALQFALQPRGDLGGIRPFGLVGAHEAALAVGFVAGAGGE